MGDHQLMDEAAYRLVAMRAPISRLFWPWLFWPRLFWPSVVLAPVVLARSQPRPWRNDPIERRISVDRQTPPNAGYRSNAARARACNAGAAIATPSARPAIPDHLMAAIGRVESGRRGPDGAVNPWPWSINAEGQDIIYESKAEAIAGVQALQAKGMRSIDVGCMQVNLMYPPHRVRHARPGLRPGRECPLRGAVPGAVEGDNRRLGQGDRLVPLRQRRSRRALPAPRGGGAAGRKEAPRRRLDLREPRGGVGGNAPNACEWRAVPAQQAGGGLGGDDAGAAGGRPVARRPPAAPRGRHPDADPPRRFRPAGRCPRRADDLSRRTESRPKIRRAVAGLGPSPLSPRGLGVDEGTAHRAFARRATCCAAQRLWVPRALRPLAGSRGGAPGGAWGRAPILIPPPARRNRISTPHLRTTATKPARPAAAHGPSRAHPPSPPRPR